MKMKYLLAIVLVAFTMSFFTRHEYRAADLILENIEALLMMNMVI